jgi:hypothetical protein
MAILLAPSFPLVPGECAGDRIVRVVRYYAGASLSSRRPELAALIGRGIDDESMVALKTNCATFACGVLYAAGCRFESLCRPIKIGMSFATLVDLGGRMGAWRDPAVAGPPKPGAVMWYEIAGTDDDHAEFHLAPPDEHGGGGRADNAITIGDSPEAMSWGRPMHRWLDPDALGI